MSLLTSNLWVHRFNKRLAQLQQNQGTSVDKRMSDSFAQVFLPFRQDASLRDEYSSHFGKIRVGKVLEDLDALGGYIAYLHVVGASIPLAVVTASVDRMDMHGELPVDRDVSLSGH
ncbi:hypothetical protein HDU99_002295, partial [Rhizoclosmatium hyalinum]